MRLWGALCLVAYISSADARIIDAADRSDDKETRGGISVTSHTEDQPRQEENLTNDKGEGASLLKENRETLLLPKEEVEKPEPYLILPVDKLSPPSGGVRLIDPKFVNENPLLPAPEIPWWERWWNWLVGEE